MRYIVIINPISGAIDKSSFKKRLKLIFDAQESDYQIYETTKRDDGQKVLDLIDKYHPDRLLICGGDGTFSMFAEVLQQTQIPVGFVPMGSANGLAADMNIEGTPRELIKKYLSAHRVGQMDSLVINEQYPVLHLADIGLNANMVKDYDKDPQRGWFTYARYALYHLQKVANFKVSIKNQKDLIQSKGVMVAICNGNTFGTTGIRLNKISYINDGKFEIVVIKAMRFTNLISASLSRINDDWYDDENYEVIQTDRAEIQLEKPMQLQIDGEIINAFDKITVTINPKSINYIKI